ncbi:MAG TPA: HYR domain-containing protein, partial [Saprospiraceae bacterium]|nr:HYR domain-containing protein [Saprospiraceae bacterium]
MALPDEADAGLDQLDLCPAVSATLHGNQPAVGVGTWSVVSGPSISSSQFSDVHAAHSSFTPLGGLGVYVLQWTIANPPCAVSTDEVILTFGDAINPTVLCPPDVTVNSEPGKCGAVLNYPSPSFGDNCTGAYLVLMSGPATASGSMFAVGTTNVEWKATDGSVNMAVCNFTVTVKDVQMPTITCPANVVRGTDAGLCTAVVTYPAPTVGDNCSSALTLARTAGLPSGSAFPKGATTVTYTVSDAGTPPNVAQCSFTVTVNDTEAPKVTCPANQSKNTDAGLCTAVVTYAGSFTDNCPGGSLSLVGGLASGSAFPKGTTTVVLKATDAMGLSKTCSFMVMVSDKQAPVATCPAPVVRSTDANVCTATVSAGMYPSATFTDNCAGGSITRISGLAPTAAFPKGTSVVVWRAVDASGNSKTCSHTVTVNDTQQPVATCPSNIVKNNDANVCGAVATYGVGATDNCAGVTTSLVSGLASGSTFPVGVTTVVWRAVDASGNVKTCAFTVTVSDVQAPMVMCPGNLTVAGTGSGAACGYASAQLPAAQVMMENCTAYTLTSNAPATLPGNATTVVVWTAKDAALNQSQCQHTVTVTCTSAPEEGGAAADRGASARAVAGVGVGLDIRPNPATDRVVLTLTGVGERGGDVSVYDALGRLVWESNVGAGQEQLLLDVSRTGFASGLYQVRLRTQHGMATKA